MGLEEAKVPDISRGFVRAAKENCGVLMSEEACVVCPTFRQKFKYEFLKFLESCCRDDWYLVLKMIS